MNKKIFLVVSIVLSICFLFLSLITYKTINNVSEDSFSKIYLLGEEIVYIYKSDINGYIDNYVEKGAVAFNSDGEIIEYEVIGEVGSDINEEYTLRYVVYDKEEEICFVERKVIIKPHIQFIQVEDDSDCNNLVFSFLSENFPNSIEDLYCNPMGVDAGNKEILVADFQLSRNAMTFEEEIIDFSKNGIDREYFLEYKFSSIYGYDWQVGYSLVFNSLEPIEELFDDDAKNYSFNKLLSEEIVISTYHLEADAYYIANVNSIFNNELLGEDYFYSQEYDYIGICKDNKMAVITNKSEGETSFIYDIDSDSYYYLKSIKRIPNYNFIIYELTFDNDDYCKLIIFKQ